MHVEKGRMLLLSSHCCQQTHQQTRTRSPLDLLDAKLQVPSEYTAAEEVTRYL